MRTWFRSSGPRSDGALIGESLHRPEAFEAIFDRHWSVGDTIDLANGEGAVQVTPLQLAVAYAALANGGGIVRPHVAEAISRRAGGPTRTIGQPPARVIRLGARNLATIRAALRAAASQPGGTSADVFESLPAPVYGATGTGLAAGRRDSGWFAGWVHARSGRNLVVAVRVDGGGFGDVVAAPVARQLFSQWAFGRPGPWRPGTRAAVP